MISRRVIAALFVAGTLIACARKDGHEARPVGVAPDDHAAHGSAPPAPHDHTAHEMPAPPAEGHGASRPPPGYAPLQVDERQAAAMNLTTTRVEERDFTTTVRSVGVIAADETRTAHVHTKVRGWVEGISVSFVGQHVKRGQALCSIYSQEVFAAQLELLALLDRSRGQEPAQGAFADVERRAQAQVADAARRRLALWDVPGAEIARLERTREPRRAFTLSSPRPGTVVSKQAVQGMFVDPSLELYVVSDLSRVWVLVDVYEGDAPFVGLGTKARLTLAGVPDGTIESAVTFVAPTVDETTRTLKVRFELDNADGRLRPGTFATAQMMLPRGRALGVPESAVIRTGERAIVFVVHGAHVEPREVRIGAPVSGYYPVLGGLRSGELVATGAQFLLDSESRLRATSAPGGAHGGH